MSINWDQVRREFPLARADRHDFATMVQASNPESVSRAIATQRSEQDRDGFSYLETEGGDRDREVLEAINRYFDVPVDLVAPTYSTTMGLAQILGGVRMSANQEFLTSKNEHPATIETLELRARRDGTAFRQFPLFVDSRLVTEDEIIASVQREIRPSTRY